jgi:WD40 repeat protein
VTYFKLSDCATVAFSSDGKKIGASGGDQVKLWDVATGKELASFQHHLPVYGGPGPSFRTDVRMLAAANFQEIDLWDVATGKERATLSEHRGQVAFLGFSPDGKTLIGASYRNYDRHFRYIGDLKLWDVATHKERIAFKGPLGYVQKAVLSPDSRTLAVLDSPEPHGDPDLRLLDVAAGQERTIPRVPAHSFLSAAFTADGRLFVTGTPDDKTIKLWEVMLPARRSPARSNRPQ